MITASVVAYHHSYSEIGKVLDCLLKSPVAKIYVVDNSSNDALRLLERISGRIRYIHSANIGYGGAHNIAMREAVEAGADYHVIVNPDIWFGEGVIGTQMPAWSPLRPCIPTARRSICASCCPHLST